MDIKSNCSVLILSKDNYSVWRTQTDDILEAHALDGLVKAKYEDVNNLDQNDKTKEAKGWFYLRSTLNSEDKLLVAHCKTVKEILNLLETS